MSLVIALDAGPLGLLTHRKVQKEGIPTAGDEALDADVLLAAQLLTSKFASQKLVVATTNPKHIGRFLDAREWKSI